MFHTYTSLYLQKSPSLKNRGKTYNLISNKRVIGSIVETDETSNNIWNQLLTFTRFSNVRSLHLNVVDHESNLLGIIKKQKGYYNDFHVYSKEGLLLAIIKPSLKIKSSKMVVNDINGNKLIEAVSGYGATNFSVVDGQSNEQISTIKRRSLVFETVKENFLNDDGYYIENNNLDDLITLSLIAMGIILEVYYFSP